MSFVKRVKFSVTKNYLRGKEPITRFCVEKLKFLRRVNAQIIGESVCAAFFKKHLGWKTSDGGKNSNLNV